MDAVYLWGNLAAMACWLLLLVSLVWRAGRERIWLFTGLVAPALFGLAYIALIALAPDVEAGGFGSLQQVMALFADPVRVNAGWYHYLAFDLFVGTWIAREGTERRIPALALAPCLLLTLVFGPAGLLLYLFMRALFARRART